MSIEPVKHFGTLLTESYLDRPTVLTGFTGEICELVYKLTEFNRVHNIGGLKIGGDIGELNRSDFEEIFFDNFHIIGRIALTTTYKGRFTGFDRHETFGDIATLIPFYVVMLA